MRLTLPIYAVLRNLEEENDSGHLDTETSAEELDTADSDNEDSSDKASMKPGKKLGKGVRGGKQGHKLKDGKQKGGGAQQEVRQKGDKQKGPKQSSGSKQQSSPKQKTGKQTKIDGKDKKNKQLKSKKGKKVKGGPPSDAQTVPQKPENEFRLKKAKLAKSLVEGKQKGNKKQDGAGSGEGKKVLGFKTKKQDVLKKKLKNKKERV